MQGGMAESSKERESYRRSDIYLREIAAFCHEDSDKPKACSVLGRKVGWQKDTLKNQGLL